MQLARADLKSDTVSDLGGIKAALEFLAMRDKAAQSMRDAIVEGAIDLRKLRYALTQLDALVMRFSPEEAAKVVREIDASDAFTDAIKGRGLPKPGRHLQVTAKHGERITSIGACWPSVEHPGFYYCVVAQNPLPTEADALSTAIWTKRPVSGEVFPIDGILHEPVWDFLEQHMGAPATTWEFRDDGVLPEFLADEFDMPFLVAESGSTKKWPDADSRATADLLESAGIVPPYPR
jgi:hypothetical protein